MPECRHILLTGGTSGIGLEAANRLLQAGHRLSVLCRNGAAAAALRQRLSGWLSTPICDLADLQAVARCAQGLVEANEAIDTLVLNAGLQYTGAPHPRWSVQGFELTLAVNHLAHQALLQQVMPLMRLASARHGSIPVLAWSPGLVIPRTQGGFFRDSRRHNPIGQAIFAFVARDLLRLTESTGRAGALLAALATDPAHGAPGFQYWSNRVLGPGQLRFEQRQPSADACNDDLADTLWQLSAKACGLQG